MNEDLFNMSLRKFLKKVGITSQREIEAAVRAAAGAQGDELSGPLPAKVTLTVPAIGLSVDIDGKIELD
jgi:hypothetical protein